VGVFDTKIALHPDVVVDVKIYVAQSSDEIDALVAGKKLTFGTKKVEEEKAEEKKEEVKAEEATEEKAEEKAEKKPAAKKATKKAKAE